MAKNISRIVQQSENTRMVVLIGAAHIDTKEDTFVLNQPDILLKKYGLSSKTYSIEPLHEVFTSYARKPRAPLTPFSPDSPNWIRSRKYVPAASPLRKVFGEIGISTSYTFLSTARVETGFDGFIFVDQFNDDRDEVLKR